MLKSGYSDAEFRRLIERHQSRVFSIAYRILGDTGLAEEVAQDVFVALYRATEPVRTEAHELAWLRRVAVHRALDAHRRRLCRPEYAAEELHEEMLPREQGDAGNLPSTVAPLFAGLSAIQKAVILLRYQEDMLPAEIASALEMPRATVKSHLQRALQQMRKIAARPQKEVTHENTGRVLGSL